jgi:hypothetical protein
LTEAPVDPESGRVDEPVLGAVLIVGCSALGLLTAFVLRTRLRAVVVVGLLAAAGAGLGAGALLVQDDPSAADWWATVMGLAVLVPFHAWVVLGRLGASRGGS